MPSTINLVTTSNFGTKTLKILIPNTNSQVKK